MAAEQRDLRNQLQANTTSDGEITMAEMLVALDEKAAVGVQKQKVADFKIRNAQIDAAKEQLARDLAALKAELFAGGASKAKKSVKRVPKTKK